MPSLSLSDSKNYRAISKNSIISKLLDHVLIKIIGKKLNTSDYQFAYKAGLSTSLCSFLVAETISYYRTRKSNVYMLSLDATKAFDRVQYSKLFNKLIDKEICPIIIRFIMNSYLISKASVKKLEKVGSGCPIPLLHWDTGGLMMKKLMFYHHVKHFQMTP